VKIVGMLQQNWALIEEAADVTHVQFIDDASRIFDEMSFASTEEAKRGLARNGFKQFCDAPELWKFVAPPAYPFSKGEHPAGRIYSSGAFWR
jgi:hypothetical protein